MFGFCGSKGAGALLRRSGRTTFREALRAERV